MSAVKLSRHKTALFQEILRLMRGRPAIRRNVRYLLAVRLWGEASDIPVLRLNARETFTRGLRFLKFASRNRGVITRAELAVEGSCDDGDYWCMAYHMLLKYISSGEEPEGRQELANAIQQALSRDAGDMELLEALSMVSQAGSTPVKVDRGLAEALASVHGWRAEVLLGQREPLRREVASEAVWWVPLEPRIEAVDGWLDQISSVRKRRRGRRRKREVEQVAGGA